MAGHDKRNSKKSIAGIVNKILFHDKKSGKTIFIVKRDDERTCCVIANTTDICVGDTVEAVGVWQKDEKYGWQFVAEDIHGVSKSNSLESAETAHGFRALDFSNLLTPHRKIEPLAPINYDDADSNFEAIRDKINKIQKNKSKPKQKKEDTIEIGGAVYNQDMSVLISAPHNAEAFVIPDLVKSIGPRAFADKDLYSIDIPVTITSIGENAFCKCINLHTVHIPDTVTSIGKGAFQFCESLISIEIPYSVSSIEDYTFADCISLTSVSLPGTLEYIGSQAFFGCANLKEISLPPSIKEVSDTAFDGCPSLPFDVNKSKLNEEETQNEEVRDEPEVTFDGINVDGVLYSSDLSTLIRVSEDIVSCVIPDTVTHIAKHAFENSKINTIIIPNSVTSIGSGAFLNCKNLQTVSLPDKLTSIVKMTFYNCTELRSIEIPDSVVEIGKRAFGHCINLSSIHIPASVERIGQGSFEYCTGLKYLTIADDNTMIQKNAFIGCKSDIIDKDAEVEWGDVQLEFYGISIPDQLGGTTMVRTDTRIDESFKGLIKRRSSDLPKLKVHYRQGKDPVIVNIDVLNDLVAFLSIKENLSGYISRVRNSAIALDVLDRIPKERTREFIPHDMTKYINYLYDHHAIDYYPIIPIDERIGDSIERGALFTILINGKPNIVWENFNDARATYVFECSEDNYIEMRQRIFDYVMAEAAGKRSLMHTSEAIKIFGHVPRIIIHNDFNSWVTKLLTSEIN